MEGVTIYLLNERISISVQNIKHTVQKSIVPILFGYSPLNLEEQKKTFTELNSARLSLLLVSIPYHLHLFLCSNYLSYIIYIKSSF